jgi:hypothetical protein
MASTVVATATSTAATITVPSSGVQAGDVAFLFDSARNSDNNNIPTNVVPAGWTSLDGGNGTANSNGFRTRITAKILVGGDLGGSITGLDDNQVRKHLLVVRTDAPVVRLVSGTLNYEVTNGNPAPQTVTPPATLNPVLIVGGVHTDNAGTLAVDPDGTVLNTGSAAAEINYQLADAGGSPATVESDVGDTGNWNVLFSLAIEIVLGLTAAAGAFALTGQAATLKVGRRVDAAAASFALTGQAALFRLGLTMPAAVGGVTLSGIDAGLTRTRVMAADPGVFTLSGQAAGLLWGHRLAGDAGSFTLGGQAAGLNRGFPLVAAAGAFTFTGQDAGSLRSRVLAADVGAITLAGQAAGLLWGRRLVGAAGSFTLTGQAAALNRGFSVVAAAGAVALSGQAANLLWGRLLGAATGSFALAGQAAGGIRDRPMVAAPADRAGNLIPRSNDFANWSTNAAPNDATVVTGAIAGPNGGLADLIVAGVGLGIHPRYRIHTGWLDTVFTYAIEVKDGGYGYAGVGLENSAYGSGARIIVDLATGAITGSIGTIVDSGTLVGLDGWIRAWISVESDADGGNFVATVMPANGPANANTIFAGDGTSGIYVAEATVTSGLGPAEYVETGASAIVRGFGLAGQSAGLLVGRRLDAAAGGFALTGQAASFSLGSLAASPNDGRVAEIGQYPDAVVALMARPDVALALLARLHFADGTKRWHNGSGRVVTPSGEVFDGIGDVGQTRLVSIGQVEEARIGVASVVELALSGVDASTFVATRSSVGAVEGRPAEILLLPYSTDSMQPACDPVEIFTGTMTAPELRRPRRDVREIGLAVEGPWAARNFPSYGKLSPADQKRRYPDVEDDAFRYVGSTPITRWPGPAPEED